MKKTLLLARHTDAETPYWGQQDIQRELTSAGVVRAYKTGKKLIERNVAAPDLVVCSSAVRAYETARLLAEHWHIADEAIVQVAELYETSPRTLLDYLNQLPDAYHCVLLVNHNPTVSYAVEYLTGQSVGAMQPCGVACIEFALDHWAAVGAALGKLMFYQEVASSDY
jgi:phosphohistidine phosphatase